MNTKSKLVVYTLLLLSPILFSNCSENNISNDIKETYDTQTPNFKSKAGGVPAGLIKNSTKYKDSSMPSASGRDGEVTITARAMIDVDGNTTLEVTTGALDGDNRAPGTITKQQVKALDTDNPNKDNPVWTENYNKLKSGGYFTSNYEGLFRGQRLALHTNVKGIIRGTAVVFLEEIIKSRPDISVVSIDVPTEVNVGDPVTIFTEISELNGDLGATLDCVLSVDGQDQSFASGIWVDAGDTVGCLFDEVFDNPGEKNIIVRAENVTPGDYDNSNNQFYTTINVVEPQTDNASFYRWYSNFSYSEYNMIERSLMYQKNNNFSVQGWASTTDAWNIPEFVTGTISSNGNELNSFSYETFGRTSGFMMSRIFFYYSYSATELTTYISIAGNSAIYFSRDIFGDLYVSRSYESGVVYERDQIGSKIDFSFDFGDAMLSGEYPISVVADNDFEFRISGSSSFLQEVGAESADVEGEDDTEEY